MSSNKDRSSRLVRWVLEQATTLNGTYPYSTAPGASASPDGQIFVNPYSNLSGKTIGVLYSASNLQLLNPVGALAQIFRKDNQGKINPATPLATLVSPPNVNISTTTTVVNVGSPAILNGAFSHDMRRFVTVSVASSALIVTSDGVTPDVNTTLLPSTSTNNPFTLTLYDTSGNMGRAGKTKPSQTAHDPNNSFLQIATMPLPIGAYITAGLSPVINFSADSRYIYLSFQNAVPVVNQSIPTVLTIYDSNTLQFLVSTQIANNYLVANIIRDFKLKREKEDEQKDKKKHHQRKYKYRYIAVPVYSGGINSTIIVGGSVTATEFDFAGLQVYRWRESASSPIELVDQATYANFPRAIDVKVCKDNKAYIINSARPDVSNKQIVNQTTPYIVDSTNSSYYATRPNGSNADKEIHLYSFDAKSKLRLINSLKTDYGTDFYLGFVPKSNTYVTDFAGAGRTIEASLFQMRKIESFEPQDSKSCDDNNNNDDDSSSSSSSSSDSDDNNDEDDRKKHNVRRKKGGDSDYDNGHQKTKPTKLKKLCDDNNDDKKHKFYDNLQLYDVKQGPLYTTLSTFLFDTLGKAAVAGGAQDTSSSGTNLQNIQLYRLIHV